MAYATTSRQYIQNVNHNDLSGIDGSRYVSFDIESGNLTWKVNPDITWCTSVIQVKGKSSNTRW